MRTPRLLVLACDAADPHLILAHRRRLPTLDRLCREGSYGIIDSLTRSGDVWTTYYTGLPPEVHGIQAVRLSKSKEPADLTKVKTDLFLWDWLNRWGLSVGFVESLYTFPAPQVNGFFVSGVPRPPHSQTDRSVHPPELRALIDLEYVAGIPKPPKLRDLGITKPFAELSDQELRETLARGYWTNMPELLRPHLERYADLVFRLYERRPVDVLWVYFLEADYAGHFLMHEQPPRTMVRAYAELDRIFGRLIARLRPETVLFISDHGMLPIGHLLTREPPNPVMAEMVWEYRQTRYRLLSPDLAVLEGQNGGIYSGTHNYQGFYALRGPGVYRGQRSDIHFHDGFRLIVRAAGLPVPAGRAGRTPPVFNEFSQRRAAEYDQQQWASNPDYLSAFLAFADLRPEHHVLEAGVGTGQVAAAGAPRVARYVGLDNSEEMLVQARRKVPGLPLVHADLRAVPLPDRSFDRVLARSVLHHVTQGLDQVMRELYRVLRPGGRLVIGEGIPPSPESVAHFTEVFSLKEERLVLLPEHLVQLLERAGFVDIRFRRYVMPQVSVRGWLERSDLSDALKARLLEMHRTTPPAVQRAYRTTITEDDVLVDFTFALVSGSRPHW
ncbi:MAG: hypothetical protein A6D92_01820 [Symbiobacterium thermophilum]|uniref:Methyltransferase type 11 domain-containing protein n=1 Tax=Symbiobacterium thermophilum TaxID=2734 RepID=A0A1Y2T6D9_SYMTR|nr:MAG: hypothetical protein A6D92_01820 [Symbiobacterium thermophilum]